MQVHRSLLVGLSEAFGDEWSNRSHSNLGSPHPPPPWAWASARIRQEFDPATVGSQHLVQRRRPCVPVLFPLPQETGGEEEDQGDDSKEEGAAVPCT